MVDDHIKRKILLLGDGAVGKTSLIRRFVVDKFSDEYITTIGTKVTKKDLRIESPGKVTDLTFMIWDVLGQKGYKGIQESSFQGAKGALLMYDVTRSETAESLQDYWIPHLVAVTNSIPLVVVGNKLDLADSRRQGRTGGRNAHCAAATHPRGRRCEGAHQGGTSSRGRLSGGNGVFLPQRGGRRGKQAKTHRLDQGSRVIRGPVPCTAARVDSRGTGNTLERPRRT